MRGSRTSRTVRKALSGATVAALCVLVACGGNGGGGGGDGGGGAVTHWYVQAVTGSDAGPGTETDPFRTITHALSVALHGHTVHVAPGTYDAANGETFPIVVPEDVDLVGDVAAKGLGATPTEIIGGGVVPPPNILGMLKAAVLPQQSSLIAGFRVVNDEVPQGTNFPMGLVLQEPGVVLRNNTVELSGNGGVYCYNDAGDHVITDNVVRNHAISPGILFIYGGVGSRVEGNVIVNNAIGVEYDSAGGDMGGGPTGSTGGNVISCNTDRDVWTNTDASVTLFLENNLWDHVPPTVSTMLDATDNDILSFQGAVLETGGAGLAPSPCP